MLEHWGARLFHAGVEDALQRLKHAAEETSR